MERDVIAETKASPYILEPKTLYQGEGFLGYVEGEDCVLTRAYLKDEVLAPEEWSQNYNTPFKEYLGCSMHGSLEN